MNKEINMKKDPAVELARIFGCLLVVGVHCWINNFGVAIQSKSGTYIACIFADGVAVFWIISGFFMYKNYSYKQTLKRTIKSIIIPMLLLSAAMFFVLNNYLNGNGWHFILHSKDDYKWILNSLLIWTNPVDRLGHFWYLYVYILLMLCSPVIAAFIKYLEEDTKREKMFLVLTFLLLVWNDLSNNQMGRFEHHAFAGAFPAAIESVWGYLLYKYRDRLRKRRYIFISVGAFLGLNVLRMAIQLGRYHRIQDTATYILYWFSSIGLLCAICVIVFSFAAIHSRKATVVNRVICWLASYTFSIYLLHPVVNSFLDMYEVRSRLSEALLKFHIGGVGKEILYMICIIFIVVSICLAISCVLRGCKMAMVRVVSGKADK
mgnify:FL=1